MANRIMLNQTSYHAEEDREKYVSSQPWQEYLMELSAGIGRRDSRFHYTVIAGD